MQVSLQKIPRIYWAAAVIAVVVLFYVYSALSSRSPHSQRFDIPFSRFVGAEQLRTARSKELIAEIEKLIAQNGLPADVFEGLSTTSLDSNDRAWLQEQHQNNIAIVLHEHFRPYYESASPDTPHIPLRDDLQKLWDASPIGAWDIDELKIANVRPILNRFDEKRYDIRRKLENPKTVFYYIFERGTVRSNPTGRRAASPASVYRGTIVSTTPSKYLADYALLEEYAVALALLDGNIEEAIKALDYIFRIAYLASNLADVGARGDAVLVRLRAYDVLQRIILDSKLERRHLLDIRHMLTELYQHWVPENIAWFGDRAHGLMFYRRIIMYGPVDTLTQEGIDELERRGIRSSFSRHFRTNHEADTVFYLQSMQKILDISQEPLANRMDVLDTIYTNLLQKQDSYDSKGVLLEPVVAGILLKDVYPLMRLFAQDQSALNRSLVAVLHSLGQRNTGGYRNPFTNEPYEIHQDNGMLAVNVDELPRPFRVPVFAD